MSATLRYVPTQSIDPQHAVPPPPLQHTASLTLASISNWTQSTNISPLQGVHNLCTANHVIHDPLLTDLGHEQCAKLRESFPHHDKIDLVTASPLRRTIYTALESFEPVFQARPDMKLIGLPDVQETSDVPCDTGSAPQALREEFAGKPVDLELVHEDWNNKVRHFLPEFAIHTKLLGRPLRPNPRRTPRARSRRPQVAQGTTREGHCSRHTRRLPSLLHRRLGGQQRIPRHRMVEHRVALIHFLGRDARD